MVVPLSWGSYDDAGGGIVSGHLASDRRFESLKEGVVEGSRLGPVARRLFFLGVRADDASTIVGTPKTFWT